MTFIGPVQPLVLTPDEAATALGKSVAQLRRWRVRNRGPEFFDLGKGLVRYSRPAVDAAAALYRARRAEAMRDAGGEDETGPADDTGDRPSEEDRNDD